MVRGAEGACEAGGTAGAPRINAKLCINSMVEEISTPQRGRGRFSPSMAGIQCKRVFARVVCQRPGRPPAGPTFFLVVRLNRFSKSWAIHTHFPACSSLYRACDSTWHTENDWACVLL